MRNNIQKLRALLEPKTEEWKKSFNIIIPWLLIVGTLQYFFAGLLDKEIHQYFHDNSIWISLLRSFINCVGTYSVIIFYLKYFDNKRIYEIGLNYFSLKNIYLGILIAFSIFSLGFLTLVFFKQIIIQKIKFDLISFLISILICLFISLSEETLIRGYILNNLLNSFNKYIALFISALIFSLFHIFNPNINVLSLLNLFTAGILLGLPYIIDKNLWYSYSLHFAWNLFQGPIYGFKVSGIKFNSLFILEIGEPNKFNGGKFGFEGSIVCLLFQIIAIVLVFKYYRSKSPKIYL